MIENMSWENLWRGLAKQFVAVLEDNVKLRDRVTELERDLNDAADLADRLTDYSGPPGSWEHELSNEFIETRGPREGEPIDPNKFIAPDGRLFQVGEWVTDSEFSDVGTVTRNLDGRMVEVFWDFGDTEHLLVSELRRVFTANRPPKRINGTEYICVNDSGTIVTYLEGIGWRCGCCNLTFDTWQAAVVLASTKWAEILEGDR